jgi:ADP-ribose pyrophosphatase YjhB (NUDIX family)
MRTRLIVGMLVISERDEFLQIQREEVAVDQEQPDLLLEWVALGGGLEEYENYEEAEIRELREETGIRDGGLFPQI